MGLIKLVRDYDLAGIEAAAERIFTHIACLRLVKASASLALQCVIASQPEIPGLLLNKKLRARHIAKYGDKE
jgi:hypothetical protein